MADLDDFFAKKDRKKNKGKKFTTTDEIAKKLEETGKKIERTKKDRPVQPPLATGQEGEERIIAIQEDEWKEFEEEKKDYTGLKIGNLQITEGQVAEGDGDGDDEGVMEENEAGEMVHRKKVVTGPWKMVNTQQQAEPQPAAPVVIERQKRPEGPAGPTSYVPPFLRGGGQPKDSTHGHSMNMRMKNKGAPDINNEDFFPTLSGGKTADPTGAWGKKVKGKCSKYSTATTYTKLPTSDFFKAQFAEISSHPRSETSNRPESGDSRSEAYAHPNSSYRSSNVTRTDSESSSPAKSDVYRHPNSQAYRHPNSNSFNRNNSHETTRSSNSELSWRRDDSNFEEVRNSKASHYSRGYADSATKVFPVAPSATGPKLNLGNKYDALNDGDQS